MSLWFLVAMALTSDPSGSTAPNALVHSVTLTLAVEEPEQSADILVKLAAANGGYFTRRNINEVVLKVPQNKRAAIIDTALEQGLVLSRTENARDVSTILLERRTLLGSRQSVLEKYFDVMTNANVGSVVQVERQITSLIQEIETLKGQVRLMEHELQYAVVTIRYRFKKRRPPTRDGTSPFPWLNTVNIVDVLGAYR